MLSAHKDLLITGDAFRENKQVFEVPPVLKEFTRLLRIIKEELVTYRIWPVRLPACQIELRLIVSFDRRIAGSFVLSSRNILVLKPGRLRWGASNTRI